MSAAVTPIVTRRTRRALVSVQSASAGTDSLTAAVANCGLAFRGSARRTRATPCATAVAGRSNAVLARAPKKKKLRRLWFIAPPRAGHMVASDEAGIQSDTLETALP